VRVESSLCSVNVRSVRSVRSWIVSQDLLAIDFSDLSDNRTIWFPEGGRLWLGVPLDTRLPKQAEGDKVAE
jgi:hypothetical protein